MAPADASPCTGVCTLDGAGRYCLGCGRTLAEIGAWRDADGMTRAAIRARAAQRIADGKAPPPIR